MNKKIFITGLGSISNCGDSKEKLMDKVFNGKDEAHKYGLIKKFDVRDYINKKGLLHLNRSTHLLLSASFLAMKDAELEIDDSNARKVGVAIGNVFGSLSSIQGFDRTTVEEGPKGVKPMQFSNCVKNSEAANISIKFGPKAFNVTLASGMASSIDAIGYSIDMINDGYCDIALTGGVEEYCPQLEYGCRKLGILTKDKSNYGNGYGNGKADGIVLSEGSGILILENEESVKSRQAKTYGKVVGYSRRFCYDESFKEDMKKCMRKAIEEVGISCEDINFVIGSFSGINKQDIEEREAILDLFSENKILGIYSQKMITGETFSAGGSLASIIGTLILNNEDKLPKDSKIIENGVLKDYDGTYMIDIKYVMINAFDVMGQLSSLIIER